MSKKSFTTAAVVNSKTRKRENKQKKMKLLSQEAGQLHITTTELLRRKALEAERISDESRRRNNVIKVHVEAHFEPIQPTASFTRSDHKSIFTWDQR